MKVLLTGASGFIGSHLLPRLEEEGHEVYCMTRFITGRLNAERQVFADLKDSWKVNEVVRSIQPEAVMHLAALSPVSYSFDHPQEVIDVNLKGTVTLAESCMRLVPNLKIFIASSTSEVYGQQKDFPINEKASMNATSPYALSKIAMDKYLQYMWISYRFPVCIMRPFNCYDVETEVLTNEGWKLFNELNKNETIATLNSNGYIDFQKPVEYITTDYEGMMISVSGNQLDMLITPNHRMYVKRRYRPNYEIMPASDLIKWNGKRSIIFKLYADWETFEKQDSKWYNPNWLKFMAWWLSEGSLDRRERRYEVDIRQCNEENLTEIRQIIDSLGYKQWNTKERARFRDKELYEYLLQFGRSKERFVPPEIKKLPRELIRLFINTYQKGDGSIGYFNNYESCDNINSSSPQMLDDLQELIFKAGWSSSKKAPFLTIARTKVEVCPRTENNFTAEKYNDKIFCVSVPNEILYVRRNGKVAFCGNSYGRKKNRHFVVEKLVTNMLLGTDPLNMGGKTAVRDLMYVDDHVEGYIKALENHEAVKGEAINLCTGHGYSIEGLAHLIRVLTAYKGKIRWNTIPARPNDIWNLVGDNSKAKALLKWKPAFSLNEGLKKSLSYWRHELLPNGNW